MQFAESHPIDTHLWAHHHCQGWARLTPVTPVDLRPTSFSFTSGCYCLVSWPLLQVLRSLHLSKCSLAGKLPFSNMLSSCFYCSYLAISLRYNGSGLGLFYFFCYLLPAIKVFLFCSSVTPMKTSWTFSFSLPRMLIPLSCFSISFSLCMNTVGYFFKA